MKKTTCLFFALILIKTHAQTNLTLTNHIVIGNSGICLSIANQVPDKEVMANSPLYWILDNTTSNQFTSVCFIGMEHAFSTKLFDSQGHIVPLTDYGTQMNSGPVVTNHLYTSHRTFQGVRDFPSVEKLFRISASGAYILEVRYWYWDYWTKTNKQFRLTDPVRLKVIKRPDKVINVGITNSLGQ
jgi:hypothetical protein